MCACVHLLTQSFGRVYGFMKYSRFEGRPQVDSVMETGRDQRPLNCLRFQHTARVTD